MARLNTPIAFTAYQAFPATDSPELHHRQLPKGITDSVKREWYRTEGARLQALAIDAGKQAEATGSAYFASLESTLIHEAKQCVLASKRKNGHVERAS
jgi:hypothetical protein